jgi:Kef-type K+ transport system membrane component KefB
MDVAMVAGAQGGGGLFSPTMNLLIVMVLIWTVGVVFRRFKQPPLLGELFAGIIFGPPVLGIITPDPTLEVLSDLGVFFLMFYAGLETDPRDLKRYLRQSTTVGIGGFVVPLLGGYLASVHIFGLTRIEAAFVGLGLAITAIAVNARLLTDTGLTCYRICPVIIGASIVDDVLSLALLSALIGYVNSGSGWLEFWEVMFKVFMFFGVSTYIGMKVYPRLSEYFSSREAKGFTFSLIAALLFGLMAELAGLHVIIGAYMAGLFLREGLMHRDLFTKIKDRFVAITYGFVGPIFFVSLSFHVTFGIFSTHLYLVAVMLAIAVTGKVLGGGAGAALGGMNPVESSVIGLSMNGRGAVELIIASIGLKMGFINDELFSVLLFVAFATTLMTPMAVGSLLKWMRGSSGAMKKLEGLAE